MAQDAGEADAILVNAGVTHPQRNWLERLRQNGRLLLPMTAIRPGTAAGTGYMLLVRRSGDNFAAEFVSPVSIYSGTSGRDEAINGKLNQLFRETLMEKRAEPKTVRLDDHSAEESCWLHTADVCLSTLA